MSRTKHLVYWNVPVPKPLDKAVEDAVEYDSHVSKSDLIREAVREKLEKMGVKVVVIQASGGEKRQ
ncbi:MAG: ribbon-helix-helix protein, CopG family [Candidatus Bathyarchaeia archaeon]